MPLLDTTRRLKTAKDRAAQSRIIAKACTDDPLFVALLRLTLDPFVDFGLKSVPAIVEDDGTPGSFGDVDFAQLLDRLVAAEGDGRALVRGAAECCDFATWNECYRPLLLRSPGLTIKTFEGGIRRAQVPDTPGIGFPGPQIAAKAPKPPARGERLVDTRLAGERVLVLPRRGDEPEVVTVAGDRLETDLRAACGTLMRRFPGPVVLDGIITPRTRWTYMEPEPGEPCLALFDILPLAEFRQGRSHHTQAQRHAVLTMVETNGGLAGTGGRVWVLPKLEVNLAGTEGRESFEQFRVAARQAGHKGVVIKDPTAPYVSGLNRSWLEVS